MDTTKIRFARAFGLPVDQMRYFNELTENQKKRAEYLFGTPRSTEYMYAVKSDGELVSRREKLAHEWRI